MATLPNSWPWQPPYADHTTESAMEGLLDYADPSCAFTLRLAAPGSVTTKWGFQQSDSSVPTSRPHPEQTRFGPSTPVGPQQPVERDASG